MIGCETWRSRLHPVPVRIIAGWERITDQMISVPPD
jgi:hypothetical protein